MSAEVSFVHFKRVRHAQDMGGFVSLSDMCKFGSRYYEITTIFNTRNIDVILDATSNLLNYTGVPLLSVHGRMIIALSTWATSAGAKYRGV